jgi:hypothetical protein
LFAQLTGRLEQCWQLSVAATRVCIALGGQYIARIASDLGAINSREIRYCLCLCYMFDKALSMSMNRPSSFPDMKINIAMLVPMDATRPFTTIVNIFLELAQVQDTIIRDMRSQDDSKKRANGVLELQNRMWGIRSKIVDVSETKYLEYCVANVLQSFNHSLHIMRIPISEGNGWGLSFLIFQ